MTQFRLRKPRMTVALARAMVTAAVAANTEACAAYVERKGPASSALLASGRTSAEIADHVGRVVALVADELRAGFHIGGAA